MISKHGNPEGHARSGAPVSPASCNHCQPALQRFVLDTLRRHARHVCRKAITLLSRVFLSSVGHLAKRTILVHLFSLVFLCFCWPRVGGKTCSSHAARAASIGALDKLGVCLQHPLAQTSAGVQACRRTECWRVGDAFSLCWTRPCKAQVR